MEGGIICPNVPDAQITPVDKVFLYLCLSITGSEITPIAMTLAPTTPVEAASRDPTKMVEMAKPPLILPNKSPMASNNCSANLVFCRITPIKINKGTAIKMVFCITLMMR